MSELLNIQKQFQEYLLHPSDVIPNFFVSTEKISAEKRLDVYLEAYQLRLVEVLETNYPILKKYLGDEKFYALCFKYLNLHPSSYRSIRWFGDRLAEFMADKKVYKKFPHLIEVAKIEWLLSEVFDEADANVFNLSDMMKIPIEKWPTLRFHFHPAIRRFNGYWNVLEMWDSYINDKPYPLPQAQSQVRFWVLWRKELVTYFCELSEIDTYTFDTAKAGKNWEQICQGLNQWMDEDQIPIYAASLLKQWIVEGMICGIN